MRYEGRNTSFVFFKNTPFTDIENTIHFSSNDERDSFFLKESHYTSMKYEGGYFNFIRDRSTISLKIRYEDIQGYNYCTFLRDGDNTRYYAQVVSYKYDNENTTTCYLLIDGIMTFLQGDFITDLNINNVLVDRQHLSKSNYKNYELNIRSNDDMLKTSTLEYVRSEFFSFSKLSVVFQCSVDLSAKFGTESDPKMKTSKGGIFDKIASPVDIYCISYTDFLPFMGKMNKYPWITQNFQKILLIPTSVFDDDVLETVDMSDNIKYDKLKKFKNNKFSKSFDLSSISKTSSEIFELFNIDEGKSYLLRSGYCNIEMYDYAGQQVAIEVEFLPDGELKFTGMNSIGYHNELAVYPDKLKSRDEKGSTGTADLNVQGTSLNNALHITTFDDVPILIDNYRLSLANNAHQRQLAESKQLSSRVDNVLTGSSGNGMKGRLMDAASLISNVSFSAFGTLGNFFGQASSEYEFYRQQKAEFQDKAISSPSVTAQSSTNSFQIANNIFGVWVRYSRINDTDLRFVDRYHGLFGFHFGYNMKPDRIDSMSRVNFLKFSGNWYIPDCDPNIFAMIKAQLENGVKFWHNKGEARPFQRDVFDNERVN